jgi:hypothetical protein
VETTQAIVGSSYVIFEPALRSLDGSDMLHFLLVAWEIHPDLIPREVGCIIPEPVEPFVEGERSAALPPCIRGHPLQVQHNVVSGTDASPRGA